MSPVTKHRLTRSSLLYLLRNNRKGLKQLHHYLHRDVLHRFSHRHVGMFLEPFEEILDLLEDGDELIPAGNSVFCHLYGSVSDGSERGRSRPGTITTKRRAPAPAKMTFAGENT